MKIISICLQFLLSSVFLTSSSHAIEENIKRCLLPPEVDNSGNTDYFPDKIEPLFSKYWDITYHNTYKVIKDKARGASYLLYQCGTELPANADQYNLTVAVPLQDGIAITQTTQIPQIEQLGLRRQIKVYLGDSSWVSSPCLQTLRDENIMKTLNSTTIEAFLVDHPELVIINGPTDGASADRVFTISEFKETTAKAIYEWHKVYAALFNSEAIANDQFDASVSRFDCTSDNAAVIAEERRIEEDEKSTILWAMWWNYEDHIGWEVAKCDPVKNYYCEWAELCHVNILHSTEGSIPDQYNPGQNLMNDTEFLEFGKDADFWIFNSYNFATVYESKKDILDQFQSVKNDKVYDLQGSGPSAWFEQRFAEYDVVLQDFCDVVEHYEETQIDHKRKWFRKVLPLDAPEEMGDLGLCGVDDLDTPWKTRAEECSSAPAAPGAFLRKSLSFLLAASLILLL